MRFLFLFLVLYCFSATAQLVGPAQAVQAAPFAMRWTCVKNLDGPVPRAESMFTLIYKGSGPMPVTGWTIYFNGNRAIDTASEEGNLRIRHVNGDLFCLTPDVSGSHATSGGGEKMLQVRYVCSDLSLNISDAPIGFYLVWDRSPGKGYSLTDYEVSPIEDEHLHLLTPAMEYARNAAIKDIPVGQLPLIFPTPVSCRVLPDSLRFDGLKVTVADAAFIKEADYLRAALGVSRGARVAPIILRRAAMDSSAYRLHIGKDGIVIEAATSEGIFYGVQSLLEVIGRRPARRDERTFPAAVPCLDVDDRARFGYRGLMVDVARNFRSFREMCRILDVMALCKMNVLHLHLTDDEGWRLEIPGLPELTAVGGRRGLSAGSLPPSFGSGPVAGQPSGSGYYTRAQFVGILRYAKARHIQVIPEIECPGHARAAIEAMNARYISYNLSGKRLAATKYLLRDTLDHSIYEGAQLWKDNVVCAGLKSVYTFMDKVMTEIAGMYHEAGAPLTTIHMGGDEVPSGAWGASPACRQLAGTEDSLAIRQYCWAYFYNRLDSLLDSKGLTLSGWEETAVVSKKFHAYVWDNMIGGGNEDLPYRLANAGNPVILSCVSNNYFDLAYERSFDERGYHWAGFQNIDKSFAFIPYDYYRNSTIDWLGNTVARGYFAHKEKLTAEGRRNILGIEGLLWGENLSTDERAEYMLLPKLLGTAERAWAPDPEWAGDGVQGGELAYDSAWDVFLNVVSKKLLPGLDVMNGGYAYRIPPPGVLVQEGVLLANCSLPGFTIRYTTDGTEPTVHSPIYNGPMRYFGVIKLKAFAVSGRSGRTVTAENKAPHT